ncbi:outer membrane protein assembly factor BamB family protein [Pontibacter cellulosilyticus]|uniref:PQQ-binding-like beta-propeller repeat protein n=1 Tax=Pontibacter cellulosilyticus TaxID=1720253 RepID=A0A923N7Q5_9BACT|nr:PQQ-binding-like beta-propeller repeat protein [Pontibacter cellulosilyticus]MBC5993299.1 PQQ-binding-like beta-propeller repeat protein [Pontibacter cellulosilyticus]
MNKLWVFLLLILTLTSCKSEEKKNYGEGFKKIWTQTDLDWNATSLIIKGNKIYGLTLNEKLFKADLLTGKVIWIKPALPNYEGQKPLIIGEEIYIGGRDSIFAYDTLGNLKWKQKTGQKIGHTLIPYKSQLIGSVNSRGLFAFEQSSGNRVWSIVPQYQMLSSSDPILVDSMLVVGDFDYKDNEGSSLYCINVETRKTKWNFPTPNYLTSEAEVSNSKVFINLDSSYANGFTKAIDLKSGNMIWERQTYPNTHLKPYYIDGKLFIASYKYGLLCLNPKNGDIIWSVNLQKDYPSTRILLFNGEIVFGTYDRTFYSVSMEGKVTEKTEFEYGLGEPFIFRDNLYISTGGSEMYTRIKANAQTTPKTH